MELQIRLFDEKHASELSKMIYETIAGMEKSSPDVDYRLVREEDTEEQLIKASSEGKIWVAIADNKIVGTLSLRGNRLRRFFVHPNYQKKGIGRLLLNAVADYARRNGLKEIHVGALLSAVPIYKRLGFREGEIYLSPEISQKEMMMKLTL